MMVIGMMPGNTPPPPWLAFVVGGALIGYCVYRCKTWRDDVGTAHDAVITALLFLVGGVIVFYGAILWRG